MCGIALSVCQLVWNIHEIVFNRKITKNWFIVRWKTLLCQIKQKINISNIYQNVYFHLEYNESSFAMTDLRRHLVHKPSNQNANVYSLQFTRIILHWRKLHWGHSYILYGPIHTTQIIYVFIHMYLGDNLYNFDNSSLKLTYDITFRVIFFAFSIPGLYLI